jgi:hypothetical protein
MFIEEFIIWGSVSLLLFAFAEFSRNAQIGFFGAFMLFIFAVIFLYQPNLIQWKIGEITNVTSVSTFDNATNSTTTTELKNMSYEYGYPPHYFKPENWPPLLMTSAPFQVFMLLLSLFAIYRYIDRWRTW